MQADLGKGITVRPVSRELYDSFRAEHEPGIFPNRFDINVKDALSAEEHQAQTALSANLGNLYELRLGFYQGEKMIGWSYGIQVNADTFRMATTGLLPEFQRQGIYSAFLKELAEHIKAKGFQVLFSRHYATDNQVIIPKLRFGFLISGFELTDEYGLLLRLNYYFNETRRKVMHVRSGMQQPDEAVREIIRRY
jgi:GNAT superfamily N-acetyltransferase